MITAMTDRVPGLQLHVVIDGSSPPIERTLSVPASILLSDLHQAIQAAFGWQDRHLYQFSVSDTFRGQRHFTPPESAAELDTEDASRTELAAVAGWTGAKLGYEYDFGDSWDHLITIVGDDPVPPARLECTAGRRRGPVEDCGGIHGYYNLIEALKGQRQDSAEAVEWFESVSGESAAAFDPAHADLKAINQRLTELSRFFWRPALPPEVIADVVRPVQWLLQRVGADGIELTKDGYLKPTVVQEAMQELGWTDRWYGKFNREAQTLPILDLRHQVQEWKLLRKYKGKLVLTPGGRRLVNNDAALWGYLADRLAHPPAAAIELVHAVVVGWLVKDALPSYDLRARTIAEILTVNGFAYGDGPVTEREGRTLVRDVFRMLECLNVLVKIDLMSGARKATDAGREFLIEIQRKQHGRPD